MTTFAIVVLPTFGHPALKVEALMEIKEACGSPLVG